MTNEEAIKILEYPVLKWSMEWDEREDGLSYYEAIDMAISALQQQEHFRDLTKKVEPLTLDDAIAHLDDTLSDTGRKWSCESCRIEHVQLRAWLAELRDIKQKRNEPLTLDELRKMGGEPVWCKEMQCYGIVKVEAVGRWGNMPFLVGAWHEGDGAVNFEYDICGRKLTLYRQKSAEDDHEN